MHKEYLCFAPEMLALKSTSRIQSAILFSHHGAIAGIGTPLRPHLNRRFAENMSAEQAYNYLITLSPCHLPRPIV